MSLVAGPRLCVAKAQLKSYAARLPYRLAELSGALITAAGKGSGVCGLSVGNDMAELQRKMRGRFANSGRHGANGHHSMSACDVRLRIKER